MVRVVWLNSLGLFFLPLVVFAQQPVTKITLDQGSRTSGYTLERGRLDLGIQANSLQTATKAWVRRVKNFPVLPDTLKQISPVYSYTIQDESNWINEPLQFQYHLKGKKYQYDRFFYYYNTGSQTWVKLDSQVSQADQTVTAQWGALNSLVVVAADTTDPFNEFGAIDAAAAIAIDADTGTVLYNHNADTQRSMASMTKLMTGYVLFNDGVDLDKVATYHSSYDKEGAFLRVTEGETMTMDNLMNAMLVGSANNAAYGLVGNAGYSVSDFVNKMNDTAEELGLTATVFTDPSGLDVGNITTASDYARFMNLALQNDDIAAITATPYYQFTTINYGNFHDFNNTNSLMLTSNLDITGSKTGFIYEALYCLAMRVHDGDHNIIVVVMGASTSWTRFSEAERLADWALSVTK
ncbi:MAG: serine hydrolase [Patescibacteria group bacterium]|jgi:D-alanyl-D-alanine endopeptidase (penicillin-binding protein 7)